MDKSKLYKLVVTSLEEAGHQSPYVSDANEPDTRYRAYGIPAPQMKKLISKYRNEFNSLPNDNKLKLATQFLDSGYGEQKTIALYLFDQISDYFEPDNFDLLDHIFRNLHGWSKIDAYTGSLLRSVLVSHPDECLNLVSQWNTDKDLWLRRASVVLFTRKVAASGHFTKTALHHCVHLKHDPEDLVLKGVGWCLKDLLKYNKKLVLPYIVEFRKQNVSSTVTLYALKNVQSSERQKILRGRNV